MARDVELAHAEREVDRVEIFERCGQERQVKREKENASSATRASRSQTMLCGRRQARRSRVTSAAGSRPSFRLPVR